MAVTASVYNHTRNYFNEKALSAMTLKLMLLNNTPTFVASHTALTSVAGANEVSGNGWAAGGVALGSPAFTVVSTNGSMLDCNDIVVTATGGAIGPAYKAVIYDDADVSDAPLFFIDFGEAKTADQDTDFRITINALGLFRETAV